MYPVATYFLRTLFAPEKGFYDTYRLMSLTDFRSLPLHLYIVDSLDRELSFSKVVLFSFWE